MKRTLIRIEDVASWDTLAWAFWRAARGKRHRRDVRAFQAHLEASLAALRRSLVDGTIEVGAFHRFEIQDPKRRVIHAPCFRERVLHHALMAHLEPALERYLVDDSFACRPGKGGRAAVARAQHHLQRWSWYLQMDVRAYFASIDHARLLGLLRRRIKGKQVLGLVDRIVGSFEASPGRGLPIGSLVSQHLANLYLAALDRHLLERVRVGGMVRYMDDVVVWDRDRETLRQTAAEATAFVAEHLHLEIKPTWRLQRSARGLGFAGLRIGPTRRMLSLRRKRRYRQARRAWEAAYVSGRISLLALQAGYASAHATTDQANAIVWRRQELRARPAIDV